MNITKVSWKLRRRIYGMDISDPRLIYVFVTIKHGHWDEAKAHNLHPITHNLCTAFLTAADIRRLSHLDWIKKVRRARHYNPNRKKVRKEK